jgi:hypothetical protein
MSDGGDDLLQLLCLVMFATCAVFSRQYFFLIRNGGNREIILPQRAQELTDDGKPGKPTSRMKKANQI